MKSFEEAILKNKVPLSLLDKVMFWINPTAAILTGLFFLYKLYMTNWYSTFENKDGIVSESFIQVFSILFLIFGIYMVFKNYFLFQLTFVQSNMSLIEKENTINKMKQEYGWSILKKETQYFRFYRPGKWYSRPDYVSILYDEKGFYLNCIDTRWATLDSGNGTRVITDLMEKVRKYENTENST